jgi:hypothetical protein
MRSLAQELAAQFQGEQKLAAGPVATRPTRTLVTYPKPRPLEDWVIDGQVVEGFEANGLAFPQRVLATFGQRPVVYAVIGETRYSDGRWFLDFGVTPAYVEANSDHRFVPGERFPVLFCPECDGREGSHQAIEIRDPDGGKPLRVKCPKAPKGRWG